MIHSDDDAKKYKKKYPDDSVESINPISRADRIVYRTLLTNVIYLG